MMHSSSLARFLCKTSIAGVFGLALVLIAVFLVYRPVLDAGFVWDDGLNFVERAWLYHGDLWKQYIFTGFNGWQFYFRPLVVGLFVVQARLFDGAPAPMHAITLGMQLANVLLVMLLARCIAARTGQVGRWSVLFAGLAFGLHPMLVETVTWIGCQFDQMQVMTALLGLLAALSMSARWPRAGCVAFCFFLSACSKESAAAYPAIVVLFDWMLRTDRDQPLHARARRLLSENWPTYLLLLVAGTAYLVLRKTMMGSVAGGASATMFIPDWLRLESIAYVYLKYWHVMAGVPTELNPLHPADAIAFGQSTGLALLRLAGAAAIAAPALLVFSRRFAATGGVVVAASLYLFPVLGFFPGRFDGSLYHERYAIGAIALTAALLPALLHEWMPKPRSAHLLHAPIVALALFWLGFAVLNVRSTIPLWSHSVPLWQWAASAHPGSGLAMGNLIDAHMQVKDFAKASQLAQEALQRDLDCDYCYLNGFGLAVDDGDLPLAKAMLERVRDSKNFQQDINLAQGYWNTVGYLELRLGDTVAAEQALRVAIGIESAESQSRILLAEALFAQGKTDEARAEADLAVQLASPAKMVEIRRSAERILAGEREYRIPMHTATEGVE